jgi:hypothetical protein
VHHLEAQLTLVYKVIEESTIKEYLAKDVELAYLQTFRLTPTKPGHY